MHFGKDQKDQRMKKDVLAIKFLLTTSIASRGLTYIVLEPEAVADFLLLALLFEAEADEESLSIIQEEEEEEEDCCCCC